MARNTTSKDIRDLLTDVGEFTGVYYVEWGKKAGDVEIESQVLIEDKIGTPGGSMQHSDTFEQPVFSMTVRGDPDDNSDAVWNRAVAIEDFLLGSPRVTVNGQSYAQFKNISTLRAIGRDDKNRHIVTNTYYTFRDIDL